MASLIPSERPGRRVFRSQAQMADDVRNRIYGLGPYKHTTRPVSKSRKHGRSPGRR